MNLTDLAPLEEWKKFENEINTRSGLFASIFDPDGNRITNNYIWVNPLCPVIKENDEGNHFICALAHQNVANQAMRTRKSVIDECDAGLVKIAVPIFVADEFVGIVGGCGLMATDGEVDTFLINKTTGIDESKLEPLSENIETITPEQLELLVDYITEQLVLLILKNTTFN